MIQLLTDFLCGEPGSLCALDLATGCSWHLGTVNRTEKSELKRVKQVHRWVYRLTSLGHHHWVCTSLGRSAPLPHTSYQLERADAGRWQIADGGATRKAAAKEVP